MFEKKRRREEREREREGGIDRERWKQGDSCWEALSSDFFGADCSRVP